MLLQQQQFARYIKLCMRSYTTDRRVRGLEEEKKGKKENSIILLHEEGRKKRNPLCLKWDVLAI